MNKEELNKKIEALEVEIKELKKELEKESLEDIFKQITVNYHYTFNILNCIVKNYPTEYIHYNELPTEQMADQVQALIKLLVVSDYFKNKYTEKENDYFVLNPIEMQYSRALPFDIQITPFLFVNEISIKETIRVLGWDIIRKAYGIFEPIKF